MGIRFNTNTWRAPLMLIDSWLPPAAPRPTLVRKPTQVIQLFARAGWLGRSGPARPANDEAATGQRPCTVHVLRKPGADTIAAPARSASRTGPRLVIAGRMADVCAELDRLAAQEARLRRA